MKNFCVVLLFVTVFGVSIALPQRSSSTRLDNVNVDQVLSNERLLKNYVNCLLDKGKCTADGMELKARLPEALNTNCARCSDKQRASIRKIIRFMINNKREWWNELERKYDPQGSYRLKYEDELKNEGIKL